MTSPPKPLFTTAYVDVSILTTGKLSIPSNLLHKDGLKDENVCLSFPFLKNSLDLIMNCHQQICNCDLKSLI